MDEVTLKHHERISVYKVSKRLFDIAFSLLVIVSFSWLFFLIAIAIKVDDPNGPVLFKQLRVRKEGKTFNMWKFRSMYADAEEQLASLMKFNEKDGPVFKIKNDPRVTRVGRFLRKTSLDELPQFFNVLFGQMSIVGPRPALSSEVAQYTLTKRCASPAMPASRASGRFIPSATTSPSANGSSSTSSM